jgi:23S rRNA (cytosine1962-C5)-methyltransferase
MQALLDAIAHMARPTDAVRIFHGRGGLHPGCEHLALDAYPPVWVLTSFAPLADDDLATLETALRSRWAELAPGETLNWVFQCRLSGAGATGTDTRLMGGSVPDPHVVTEDNARYAVHVLRGQNHGLFLDMAEGRRWVRQHMALCAQAREGQAYRPHIKVLNLFAYTCAFSVAALQGGADQVLNVDMSHGAMGTGQHNHALNGLGTGASFMMHDIFSTWGKITRNGPYDLVIVDPPSYQKGSFVATKDYARLVRRLPDLLTPGGHALLCLNAPELDESFIHNLVREGASDLTFVQRLPNPAVFADATPERALKVMLYRAPPLA